LFVLPQVAYARKDLNADIVYDMATLTSAQVSGVDILVDFIWPFSLLFRECVLAVTMVLCCQTTMTGSKLVPRLVVTVVTLWCVMSFVQYTCINSLFNI